MTRGLGWSVTQDRMGWNETVKAIYLKPRDSKRPVCQPKLSIIANPSTLSALHQAQTDWGRDDDNHKISYDRLFKYSSLNCDGVQPGEIFYMNKRRMESNWWCRGDLENDLKGKRLHAWQKGVYSNYCVYGASSKQKGN